MMDRRQLLVLLAAGALAVPRPSFAQSRQRKVPKIGFLISETLSGEAGRVAALRAGLRDLGYVEGNNITIETRSADGNYDRLPVLATDLAGLKVELIVAFGSKAVSAAKLATTTIPIVAPGMGDPVAFGRSGSLARPTGNITGSSQFGLEAAAKRVQFLKEAVPSIKRVAVLINPANAASAIQVEAIRVAANALKLELHAVEVRNAKEFGEIFSAMAQEHIDSIVVATDTLFRANAMEVANLAAKQRLPSIGPTEFAAAGGLIGFGADDAEVYRHAAYFVDKILKGAKPGDLPIELPTKLQLVINLKSAKTLGLTIPQSLLIRADEIIQ
jgi:putative tryptophan/tyrosine transport system substrate-binding protein